MSWGKKTGFLKIFYFLRIKYNHIIPPFLPSLQMLPHTPASFKFVSSFPLSVVIYKYIYMFLNTTCSVCIKIHICAFSERTIQCWVTSWCILLWGRLFLLYSASFVACSSLCRAEASGAFPCALQHVDYCGPCQAHV